MDGDKCYKKYINLKKLERDGEGARGREKKGFLCVFTQNTGPGITQNH